MLVEFIDEIISQFIILLPESNIFSRIRYKYYKKKLLSCGSFNSLPFLKIIAPEGIIIGTNCSFNYNVTINASCGGKIIIGDNVLIGPNTVLRAADHVFKDIDVDINKQGHNPGVIEIKDNVWIGANVTITKDVIIGEGSIIGAGAVVTKDIPAYSVAIGVPAKVVKNRKDN